MAAALKETAAVAAEGGSDAAARLAKLKLKWQSDDQLALNLGARKGETRNEHGGLYVDATCSELYDLQDIIMNKNAAGKYHMTGRIYGLSIGSGPSTYTAITKRPTSGGDFPAVGSEFKKSLRVTRPFAQSVEVTFTVSRSYEASPK